jgi:NAD(P) transhydrogenase
VPTAAESSGKAAGFEDFFGHVTQDILRQADVRQHELMTQSSPSHLQLSVRRDFAVSTVGFGSCVSRGRVTVASTLLDDARRHFSDLQQSFSYNWMQMQWSRGNSTDDRSRSLIDDDDDEKRHGHEQGARIYVDRAPRELCLSIPLQLGDFSFSSRLAGITDVLNAWTSTAAKALAGASLGVPLLQLRNALSYAGNGVAGMGGALPLKISGFDTAFLSQPSLDAELATHVGLFSLTSAVMFIGSIRGLNKHSTARQGNLMGMIATALGILSVLASPGFGGAHLRFFSTFLLAGILGYGVASRVQMEDMPQLVAGFHSFVGLAAVFTGFASYFAPGPFAFAKALETFLGISIGALTFTGSVVAAGKLHGWIPGSPIIFDNRWKLNFGGLASSVFLGLLYSSPAIYASASGTACLLANTAIWGALGANMVLPIGGADMPVVVSLLNACSGLATSAAGFMLSNNLLTITGALVASSGTLLSDIMCRGINRSISNVLLGGFGTDGMVIADAGAVVGKTSQVSRSGFVGMLLGAKRVVIVPGYGLAVARCQQRLADIVSLLRKHGVTVHFAIHPVAGRLPGHMNVLLAEADVPYDIVREMEDINKELPQYDMGIVIGANDIVNPSTQDDPSSPIYGMPAIEIWKCKRCVVLKRSMATGYSGVDNPLFYKDNVQMLFGDAKQSVDAVMNLLEGSEDQFTSARGSMSEPSMPSDDEGSSETEYPVPCKVIGVIRERRPREQRVAVTPAVVPKLRQMGFSVMLEAGAGVGAGFSDDDYMKCGGIQIGASAEEVLKQADVILKVNEPLLDELQMLNSSQTMAGFWNMFGAEELTEALTQSSASFVNLALVPRVSRAQKLDALTSMANIAGYKAVLDAFNRLPRFSRSSVTASGTVPPARVFVIGAGVAGLSAIATAHALGAKVYANDVRDAAREQVESMGAEFVPVDADGIQGEGVGGYAREMGSEFQEAQLATYARIVRSVDIVITTAMIPNKKAPIVVTEEMVKSMAHGSIIVDLAMQTGGNCALTKRDEVVVTPGGVTILGETNYPSLMPAQASELLSNNFVALLGVLGGAIDFGGAHWDDPIIKPATVVHAGKLLWPPAPCAVPVPSPAASPKSAPAAAPGPVDAIDRPLTPPGEIQALIQWLKDHREELAWGLGAAVILGLGIVADIPDAELTHIGYFALSLLIGHFTVAGVTPALHTPLISVTNAISGIIVVGGMLQLSGPLLSARVACALAAVFLSSINVVGGFAVTQRMLEMFREDKQRKHS